MITNQRRVPRIRTPPFYRVLMQFVIVIGAIVYVPHAKATCTFTTPYTQQNAVLALPGNITVPRNAAVGTVLATAQVPAGGPTTSSGSFASCTSPGNAYWQNFPNSSWGPLQEPALWPALFPLP